MAKGWDAVQQQSAALEEQRAEFGKNFKPELRVNAKNTGPFTIRFLEQGDEVHNYAVHEYKVPAPGGGVYHKRFTCLSERNEQCPGCTAGMKRKTRGVFNVIQRQRPVIRRGADNKAVKDAAGNYIIDGFQDEVVIANVGGPTAEMLRKSDGNYHGLMSRDFVVQYSGDTFQGWTLTPAIDASGNAIATPMTEADMHLAAQKHNLDEVMAPPTFQEAASIVARYGPNSGAQQGPGAPPAQATQHGVAPGQQGANGFLAGAAVPGGAPNAFGNVAPPAGVPPTPPVPQAPPQQFAPPPAAPAPQEQAPVPQPAPAPAPVPAAPAPAQQ